LSISEDGFDNVAEDSIIKMNRANVKLLATTVADLLVTYGWCVLIPSEENIEISNMDNVYLYFILIIESSATLSNPSCIFLKISNIGGASCPLSCSTMQMMDDEQPHTIDSTLNKYTIKGMELRKKLVGNEQICNCCC
jgi:hypothetical protein